MRRITPVCILLTGILLAFIAGSAGAQGLISPNLSAIMSKASPSELIPIDVVMREQADPLWLESLTIGKTKAERRMIVVRELQNFSAVHQENVLSFLSQFRRIGVATDVKSFWIVNAIYLKATKAVIEALVQRPDVWYIDYDLKEVMIHSNEPISLEMSTAQDTAWGVKKIEAHKVWPLGYTGQNVIVGHIDSGVNYNHHDLRDHMWTDPNYPNHGWDFGENDNDPNDTDGHGSHTAGTVAGDGTAGSQTGVAPDAQIMALKVRMIADTTAENQFWEAMEFAISPPLSPAHGADLITMSMGWTQKWNPRRSIWRTNCNNVLAAGLVMIVAAGNERDPSNKNYLPAPDNIRTPGDVPPPWHNPQQISGGFSAVVTVGATDSSDNIASFSSFGPVTWSNVPPFYDYPYPPGLIKPDVSAPGVNSKSLTYGLDNTGYVHESGTSMATPHVAGTAALMLSCNNSLVPSQLDKILETTAIDRGSPGKDNDYGAGRINAYQAVLLALAYANKSISQSATAYNNGRRLLRDSSGKYHLVFESGGEIFYRRNQNAPTWDDPIRLSTGNGSNKYPSITGTSTKQFVVWQRYVGLVSGQHKYNIYFAKNTGSGWTVSVPRSESFTTPTHPLPVVSYKQPQRVLLCFRQSGGIKSIYSNDDGVSWSDDNPPLVIGAGYRNPSLSMGPTTPNSWVYATYDNSSTVYFNRYNTQWYSAENVSGGTGLTENRDASVEIGGSGNGHVAWQGKSDALMTRGIAYRKRYTNGSWDPKFFFYQTFNEYHKPSVTGHAGEKCSIVWYNNAFQIMKVYYNGTSWDTPTLVANNGRHPNLSAGSTTAKYCWTSGTASPYEIKISSEVLQRPLLFAGLAFSEGQVSSEQALSMEHYRSAVLHDTLTNAVFWAQIGKARVKTKIDPGQAGQEIPISLVSFLDSLLVLTPENHFDYL